MSRIATDPAQRGHRFSGIVGPEGKGFTPPPWVGVTAAVLRREEHG